MTLRTSTHQLQLHARQVWDGALRAVDCVDQAASCVWTRASSSREVPPPSLNYSTSMALPQARYDRADMGVASSCSSSAAGNERSGLTMSVTCSRMDYRGLPCIPGLIHGCQQQLQVL